ncbi:hypothetical protein I204_08119 [Kwoniella mangroviensis CBS 8886]|uniref:uncharacterized protein n=1 Tax=Kwoniella mangroviensis CBS 8507 TaxID=1296122 RepID=UPI00080D7660|nr:uncharacterized protein I203_04521 [Kwoniella mangroviensis CBS 8507]OCF66195.1 hypothetical protein I203_04521 [Kwoniella mangroviensis CBS 8507]OCF71166.1 hypothetical protein I204_08119 [Kwoniella mangroviensis CBS 8886]
MPKRATRSDSDTEDTKPSIEGTSLPNTFSEPPKDKKPKLTPTKPKIKSTTTTPTKKSQNPGSPSKGIGAFPLEAKKVLLEKAMDIAYKGIPYSELAVELGISESRLKDQLKPDRSNLRKAVMDLYN